jgi:hypothetical protein
MRQFFSPYVSVGNNPVSGIDPTGGTCPNCPDSADYEAYRNSNQAFLYESGVGVYNDFGTEISIIGSKPIEVIDVVANAARNLDAKIDNFARSNLRKAGEYLGFGYDNPDGIMLGADASFGPFGVSVSFIGSVKDVMLGEIGISLLFNAELGNSA